LAARWEEEKMRFGERTTRIGMYSMQSGYTQGNVYECPRARGRDFLTVMCSRCYSLSVLTVWCPRKIIEYAPSRSASECPLNTADVSSPISKCYPTLAVTLVSLPLPRLSRYRPAARADPWSSHLNALEMFCRGVQKCPIAPSEALSCISHWHHGCGRSEEAVLCLLSFSVKVS